MLNLRHHSLIAWQRADDLFIKLHKVTLHSFPPIERFELGAQLRKAAYSVDIGYIGDQALHELEAELSAVGAPLSGLVRSIRFANAATNATVALAFLTAILLFV
jgi:hypothetical protein